MDMATDKLPLQKITTAGARTQQPWALGIGRMCLLKDQCGLSGHRDEDKIAEGVRAVIVCAYWLHSVCECVVLEIVEDVG